MFKSIPKNPNNINWNMLSRNPNAIQILEKNTDRINWLFVKPVFNISLIMFCNSVLSFANFVTKLLFPSNIFKISSFAMLLSFS